MELGREMFEYPVQPLGSVLAALTGTDWFWVETEDPYYERGITFMAEEETPEQEADGSSDLLHAIEGDVPAVAMGADDEMSLLEAMAEIENSMREFALSLSGFPVPSMFSHAQKSIFRCVDEVKRFNNEYR